MMCRAKANEHHQLVQSRHSLLSPSLFNLFLEFVVKDIRNLDGGIQMGVVHIHNIRYADDTTLTDLVFEKLQ